MSTSYHDACLGLRECSSHPKHKMDRGGTPEFPWRVFKPMTDRYTEMFATFDEAIRVTTWHADTRFWFQVTPGNQGFSYEIRCNTCNQVTFTWGKILFSPEWVIRDHLKQHDPGRAIDIEVNWEPSALCPICPDGIGSIRWDSDSGEGLICIECRTSWDSDGRGGELDEDEA